MSHSATIVGCGKATPSEAGCICKLLGHVGPIDQQLLGDTPTDDAAA